VKKKQIKTKETKSLYAQILQSALASFRIEGIRISESDALKKIESTTNL